MIDSLSEPKNTKDEFAAFKSLVEGGIPFHASMGKAAKSLPPVVVLRSEAPLPCPADKQEPTENLELPLRTEPSLRGVS